MYSKENIRKNIDLYDKFNFKNINVNQNVTYNGDYNNIFNKDQEIYEESCQKPLAASVLGLNNTNIPLAGNLDFCHMWTDLDAQEAYLMQKPATFLILGKQGTGSYNLGEAMSKKINCIHLCPKNVLLDEIEQKSPTGRCLDFNMRHNKVCKFDSVLSILKRKLQSPVILHRGFVISGLPLTTSSKNVQYFISSLYSEEAIIIIEDIIIDLICNFKKSKSKKKTSSHSSLTSDGNLPIEEEDIEEEQEVKLEIEEIEDPIVALPKFLLEPSSELIFKKKTCYDTTKIVLLKQTEEVFNLHPSFLIFITCPNQDVVTKRSRKYFNYFNSSNTFYSFPINIIDENRWPPNYHLGDLKKPLDIHTFNPKYNCKQPINFKERVEGQLCNYENIVTPFIYAKFNNFDPKKIIKLDGRTSVHNMMHITMETLLLSVKPIIIPEPLYLDDPPDDIEDFWKLVEELNVIRSDVLKFNRYATIWYNRCPVELKKRITTLGKPKLAVTFYKYVYLLSSLDAMIAFCRNPRPFLKLEYLAPTCRIIVMGTKSSGKTMISKCLSWLFNTTIICYSTLHENEKQRKYDNYAKMIFSEIMPKIEDARLGKWQTFELDRISKLNTWYNTYFSILNKYVPLLKENMKQSEEENLIFNKKFTMLKSQLSFLPVDDLQQCEDLLKNKNLTKYAPNELTVELSKPSIPTLGDEDVKEEILNYILSNDLQKDIEPTPEEIMTVISNIIINTDSDAFGFDQTFGKFIVDGLPPELEYWSYLIENKLLPDHIITVLENREVDIELACLYAEIDKSNKNYQERFSLSNDVMVKTKLCHQKPFESAKISIKILLEQFISETLDGIFENIENDLFTQNGNNNLPSLTENIEKFKEAWDILKLKLEENKKVFIETELGEDKSDIQILDEVLLNLRKSYCKPVSNVEEAFENLDDEIASVKDILSYNDPVILGETNKYCPVAFYNYNVLWEGKFEFTTKHDNKVYYSSNEECYNILQYDISKYQAYCKPFKNVPPLRICIIGSTGSGKTTVSKIVAKELGLLHINFSDYINNFFIPKHFKRVGWQYENSFIDTDVEEEDMLEFQMDEENSNLLFDIQFSEKELRRMLYNYLERGSSLSPVIIKSLLKNLWFNGPYANSGIVLDGFPKMPSDVEDMIANFCIPDLVLNLESNSETALERLSINKLNIWKQQLIEAKAKANQKLEISKINWKYFVTKTVVIKLIIDEILDGICNDIEIPIRNSSIQSTIIDAHPEGSSNIDVNLFTTYNELILEYPEPIDDNEWENPEDVLEKINNRIESIFDIDNENIQTLLDNVYENKIKSISIDGNKSFDKVIRTVLTALNSLRNRCESFLEQTFTVSCDIAEMLLLEGFFLLSKFNRICPVYITEYPNILHNPYVVYRQKNKVFPIIHRSYIYFIYSDKNVRLFRNNPLKYIQNDTITLFQVYPLGIGVIGPPKSGKSKLAAKISKEYGLMCISKGIAIRHLIENMSWTMLGLQMSSQLREGNFVDNNLIMKAVATVALDNRTINTGFVLDGFPDMPYDVSELAKLGLLPLIIFEINGDKINILKNSQGEIYPEIVKHKPAYCKSFIENRYNRWNEKSSILRNFINNDMQNIYVVNGNNSKWKTFVNAHDKLLELIPKIHYYLTFSKFRIVRLDAMGITNELFKQKMSCFTNLCPVCFYKNILRHSNFPVDKTGLVQYKGFFYWICSKHLNTVLEYPENFLSPKKIYIPEVPVVVKTINTALVYESGICIVTYADHLPSQRVIKGNKEFASIYKKKIYLFCSLKCLDKFLVKPHLYYNIKVYKEASMLPKLTLKNISHLGYLEQSVGNIITEACCACNASRPKYPGLNTPLSALLYLALYLKTHNVLLDKSISSIFIKVFKKFEARCKLVRDIGLRLRSVDNPFANYPKCCSKSEIDSDTVRKPPTNNTSTESSVSFDP